MTNTLILLTAAFMISVIGVPSDRRQQEIISHISQPNCAQYCCERQNVFATAQIISHVLTVVVGLQIHVQTQMVTSVKCRYRRNNTFIASTAK